jgi:hypothetical protein
LCQRLSLALDGQRTFNPNERSRGPLPLAAYFGGADLDAWEGAMDPVLISLISACTALVASVVGPMVTLAVAKRQINANVVSANRHKWIEALRDSLAELISMMAAVVVVKASWKGTWNRGLGALEADPKLIEKVQRIIELQWRIRLLLNPLEPDHQELAQSIHQAFLRLQEEGAAEEQTLHDIEHFSSLAQAILKREWQRVKHGT